MSANPDACPSGLLLKTQYKTSEHFAQMLHWSTSSEHQLLARHSKKLYITESNVFVYFWTVSVVYQAIQIWMLAFLWHIYLCMCFFPLCMHFILEIHWKSKSSDNSRMLSSQQAIERRTNITLRAELLIAELKIKCDQSCRNRKEVHIWPVKMDFRTHLLRSGFRGNNTQPKMTQSMPYFK